MDKIIDFKSFYRISVKYHRALGMKYRSWWTKKDLQSYNHITCR